jgi:uncharacterized protein
MPALLHHTAEPPQSARTILETLRAHESELRTLGVERLALVGSVARSEQGAESDIDLVVRLRPTDSGGYAFFGKVESLRRYLTQLLGRKVDIITEPVRRQNLRRSIEADQLLAF